MRVTILSTTDNADIRAGSVDATSDHLTGGKTSLRLLEVLGPTRADVAAPEDGRCLADI
jgi:hypothetical protein